MNTQTPRKRKIETEEDLRIDIPEKIKKKRKFWNRLLICFSFMLSYSILYIYICQICMSE